MASPSRWHRENAAYVFPALSRWSPDGKQIAFIGTEAGKPRKIYLVSPEGEPRRNCFRRSVGRTT